ncbi:MAG TPA: hypothetical protein VHV47_03925 [Opitutaceae bacterium]|jgi:hypothetical protein|nr:hypothetical protein [Opitutaceae bacterium]
MRWLDKLERRFGSLAIPNLTLYLVIGQVGAYFAIQLGRIPAGWLVFSPEAVLAGQWWRLLTFLIVPPATSFLFIAFAWYIFYLMGTALEDYWGVFHYNCFLLIGYLLALGVSFIDPASIVTNGFLALSVFLAFAYLNPTFELYLIIIPVQVRWLALLTWLYFGVEVVLGSWSTRLQVVAAVGNVLLFFGRDIWHRAGLRTRQIGRQAGPVAPPAGTARHRCRVCGKTDLSNPELDFRYCSKCAGEECYCPEHIFNHEHTRGDGHPAS